MGLTNLRYVLISLHVTGALIWGMSLLGALVILITQKVRYYYLGASLIGIITGLQLISGALLFVLSLMDVSLAFLCGKIGIYLISTILIEFILFQKMNLLYRGWFPLRLVSTSLTAGVLAVFFTVIIRFI